MSTSLTYYLGFGNIPGYTIQIAHPTVTIIFHIPYIRFSPLIYRSSLLFLQTHINFSPFSDPPHKYQQINPIQRIFINPTSCKTIKIVKIILNHISDTPLIPCLLISQYSYFHFRTQFLIHIDTH